MTTLRTLKIAKGLLAVAVAAASLHLIALSGIQPVDASEEAKDHEAGPWKYELEHYNVCLFNGEPRTDCYRARCFWDGNDCTSEADECFAYEGGYCE